MEKKSAVSSILRPFNFVSVGRSGGGGEVHGKGGKASRRHYFPSLLMKLTRAKARGRDPVAFERGRSGLRYSLEKQLRRN